MDLGPQYLFETDFPNSSTTTNNLKCITLGLPSPAPAPVTTTIARNSTRHQPTTKIKTTVEIYSNYLKYLTKCCIFPFNFILNNNNNGHGHYLIKVTSPKNLPIPVGLLFTFVCIHCIFIWVQFVRSTFFHHGSHDENQYQQQANLTNLLALSCWALIELTTVIIFSVFLYNRHEICTFLTGWNQIEWEILESAVKDKGENEPKGIPPVVQLDSNQIELEILQATSSATDNEHLPPNNPSNLALAVGLESNQIKWNKIVVSGFILCASSSVFFVCLNHYVMPEFPAYLTSIVPLAVTTEGMEAQQQQKEELVGPEFGGFASLSPCDVGLLIVSIFIQGFSSGINRFILSQFEIMSFSFARSIKLCLRLISPSSGQGQDQQDSRICRPTPRSLSPSSATATALAEAKSASNSLEHYKSLYNLVHQFNSLFKWLLVIYKLLVLLQLCVMSYSSCLNLRHSNTNLKNSSSNLIRTLSFVIFANNSLIYILKIHLVLIPMGNIIPEVGKYCGKWSEVLWNQQKKLAAAASGSSIVGAADGIGTPEPPTTRQKIIADAGVHCKELNEEMKDVCNNRIPLGFHAGCFYIVKPGTVLTFFSITTTYLIVLLQI